MKLNNTQLIELLEYMINEERTQGSVPENLPDGVSLSQYKGFFNAFHIMGSSPQYMQSFINMATLYDFYVPDIRRDLEGLQDNAKPISGGEIAIKKPDIIAGTRFVFTSAQNNTDVHKKFLKSLLSYCKLNNAELIIGKFVYNKNGFQNGVLDGVSEDIYYDKSLTPYFNTDQQKICDDLVWCGDLNILPTAKNPLTGFETLTGIASSIIPHAKIAMESVATPKTDAAKFMYATGAVTMHNYIQKKAGQVAQHAHCYGALIVEVDEFGNWFARQIQTDKTGIFQDLTTVYYPTGKTENKTPIAINWGDIHAEKSDSMVLDNCMSILDDLNPENQLFHDLFDMTARNHHNRNSGHFLAKMHYMNEESVENDLLTAAAVLQAFEREGTKGHIIESNHDLALESWLNDRFYDFRTDPINSLIYLRLQTAIYEVLQESGGMLNILQYALSEFGEQGDFSWCNFMTVDDSLIIGGIECGMHGHIGCNGSRGNPNQFIKLNRPINTGHTHTASIKGQVYTAGVTGSLDMGYNKGASSWSHSHILTYPNGFRAIITQKETNGFYKYKA